VPFSWSYSSIGFPVRRAVTSVVSCFEAYDGARGAAARADSAAARAGQHIMAAAIVPTYQIGSDGPLTEQYAVLQAAEARVDDEYLADEFVLKFILRLSWGRPPMIVMIVGPASRYFSAWARNFNSQAALPMSPLAADAASRLTLNSRRDAFFCPVPISSRPK
jgi:hypothetical protein